jgi:hypothetical protein
MPAGLAIIGSTRAYEAVAGVARTAARVAAAADTDGPAPGGGTALRGLVDQLCGLLQAPADGGAGWQVRRGARTRGLGVGRAYSGNAAWGG